MTEFADTLRRYVDAIGLPRLVDGEGERRRSLFYEYHRLTGTRRLREWVVGLAIIVGIVAALAGVTGGILLAQARGCAVTGEQMGMETEYRAWADTCFVLTPDGWFPVSQVRDDYRGGGS